VGFANHVAVRINYYRNTCRIVIYFVARMIKKLLAPPSPKFSVVYQQICRIFCPECLEHYYWNISLILMYVILNVTFPIAPYVVAW